MSGADLRHRGHMEGQSSAARTWRMPSRANAARRAESGNPGPRRGNRVDAAIRRLEAIEHQRVGGPRNHAPFKAVDLLLAEFSCQLFARQARSAPIEKR